MISIDYLRERLQRHGVVRTSRLAVSAVLDYLFDLRYGTDTLRWVEHQALDATSENLFHSSHYQPTKARPLLKLLRKLNLPRDAVFLDIGSGKGRALLIAALFGFKKVIGVEFSSQLCELAKKNVDAFAKIAKSHSPIEIVEADAANYRFRPEHNIFYFFNPFGAVVLEKVLDNIRASVQEAPRRIWLIYNNPKHHTVVDQSPLFPNGHTTYQLGGNEFKVYRT